MKVSFGEVRVTLLEERMVTTRYRTFFTRRYKGSDGSVGLALWIGQLQGDPPLLARLHSSCFTSEGLTALDCDCSAQLDRALHAIAEQGRGIVFYLLQEGRGAGLRNKIRDRELVQASGGAIDTFSAYERLGLDRDPRSYGLVPAICADLGVTPNLRLMTNNPSKIAALRTAGIHVERVAHSLPASDFNSDYLAAQARHGHELHVSAARSAVPPAESGSHHPKAETLGRFHRVAAYWLPVRLRGASVWLRATAYVDPESGHDRIVLCHRPSPTTSARREIRHVHRESFYERFDLNGPQAQRYRETLESVVTHGGGSVLAIPSDGQLLSDRSGPDRDEDHALLDAHGAKMSQEVA